MVSISYTSFTSNIFLEAILRVKTKEVIVGIETKLGAYIPSTYIIRKMPYKLQKYVLVQIYEDFKPGFGRN